MKKAYFFPRALILCLVFLVIGAGIYRFTFHHYKNVAEWNETDSQNALTYEDESYFLAGKIGEEKLPAKKYAKEEVLGEIKPDGFFNTDEPYVLWNVKDKKDYLIVAVDDIEYLYYRDGVNNPVKPTTSGTSETETAAG